MLHPLVSGLAWGNDYKQWAMSPEIKQMNMETKSYLIVDSNNEWLSTLNNATNEQLNSEFANISANFEPGEEMFAYVITGEIITFKE